MRKTAIAMVEFVGGPMRPVYEELDCRLYVIDDAGERVYGIWYIPRDESKPVVMEAADPDF
jgi:hypothetical protein